jgi:hypothetical protein
MIYARPSDSIEVTAAGFESGLVGTIGIGVRSGQGSQTTARTTSGIVEDPTGSGIYTATITAPAIAGVYVLAWDDGSGTWAAEELVVTATGSPAPAPSGGDLCTLSDVQAIVDIPEAHEDLVQRLIAAASAAITRVAGRTFAVASNPQTRTFKVGDFARSRVVPIDDLGDTPTEVLILDEDGNELAEVDLSAVMTRPLNRDPDEPITGLRIGAAAGSLARHYLLQVTGDFGFPAVPEDVRQAAITQVREWYVRDPSRFGDAFQPAEAEPGAIVPMRELSPHAYGVAKSYRADGWIA